MNKTVSNNAASSLLPPNASKLERDIEQVIASSLDLPLSISDLWDPFLCPLSLLPWLAWAYSVDQWADSWPESVKRQVVNDAFDIHRYKGTPYAVQQALNSLGIKTNILEWWESGGSNMRGTMKVLALVNDNITDENDGLITSKMLAMVTEAIRASKRGSIHFDVELGISFDESFTVAAGISPSIGISDIDADSNGVHPDDVIAFAGAFGIEHRIDCIDTDCLLFPVLPDELLFTHRLAAVSHQLIISEHELTGVV